MQLCSLPGKMRLRDRGIFRIFFMKPAFSAFFDHVRVLRFFFFGNNFSKFYCFLSCNTSYFPHLFHYCKNERNRHKTSIFMHVFMQIRVHKNAAYFATSSAYFGHVRIACFYFLAAFFQGDWLWNLGLTLV